MVLTLNHYLLRGGMLTKKIGEYVAHGNNWREVPLNHEEKIAKLEKAVGREVVIAQDNKEFVGEGATSNVYAIGILRKEEDRFYAELHLPDRIRKEDISPEHLYFLLVLSKSC